MLAVSREASTTTKMGNGDAVTTDAKYSKPRILLVDIKPDVSKALLDAGYKVEEGTFGKPYSVERSDFLHVVDKGAGHVPNSAEQEIIFASTACIACGSGVEDFPKDGVRYLWQDATEGLIDPRPVAMAQVKKSFDRILKSGGIFFVFLNRPRYAETYKYGKSQNGGFGPKYQRVEIEEELRLSNWEMLTQLEKLRTSEVEGEEFFFESEHDALAKLLNKAVEGARFYCSVDTSKAKDNDWHVLARNKFNDPIAGLRCVTSGEKPGYLVVMPELPGFADIVVELIEKICTSWCPHLFPDHESMPWTQSPEYELPRITEIQTEIETVKTEYETRVASLESDIEKLREQNKDHYFLLNGTGDELVGAVKRTLESFGFENVVDVDELAEKEGTAGSLKEDLRIEDEEPYIVVDVKGVGGVVEDGEATQAEKHALMRQNETQRVFKALSIINAQRNIPPKDRSPKPYRDEIVANAELTGLGLMTTWDLLCLTKNKTNLGWTNEQIRPMFRRSGRIEPTPEHYRYAGTVLRVWKPAFGFLPEIAIPKGARLAIKIDDEFIELDCPSIKVDDNEVEIAEIGSNCGIAFSAKENGVKAGQRIFIVESSDA